MEQKFIQLKNIDAYVTAFHLSNFVWKVVLDWDYFSKDTVGKQFTRAVDSISANVAEGFGRYGKKDKIKFYYYSLGSMKESLDWNEKSKVRNLIKQSEYVHIYQELNKLPKLLHQLMQYTNAKLLY